MKKLLLPIVFLLTWSLVKGQCPAGDVSISNQVVLDSFLTNYPNCTHLTGGVHYDGFFQAPAFYSKIKVIEGDLTISFNYGITPITLTSLDSVYGNVKVSCLPYPAYANITNVDFLSNLKYVGGHLNIHSIHELSDCSGLCTLLSNDGVQGQEFLGDNKGVCSNGDFVRGSCGLLDCPTGDVYLTLGSEAAVFHQAFPNCTEINGSLNVATSAPPYYFLPNNLDSLYQITTINGDLNLKGSGEPGQIFWSGSVAGLSNLTHIGGDIIIKNIDDLPLLDGVHGSIKFGAGTLEIDSVVNNVEVLGTGAIPNIKYIGGNLYNYIGNSLPNLEYIVGDLHLQDFPMTLTVDLPKLKRIGGNNNLHKLHSFSGFGSLEVLDKGFSVNSALSSFEGLEKLHTVGANIHITNNSSISSLEGLNSLAEIVGELTIQENSSLNNLNALANLESVGGNLAVVSNFGLVDCHGLCNLLENDGVAGGIVISANPSPCSNLQEVQAACTTDSIFVVNQGDADNFSSNNPGDTADGNLIIGSVDGYVSGLLNINGLSNLTSVTGNLIIGYNADLASLDGLEGLTSVGKNLIILNNLKITDLQALSNLTHVGGSIIVESNTGLLSLAGLGSMVQIGNFWGGSSSLVLGPNDNLEVKNNPVLANLDALKNLSTVGGDLIVSGNPALDDCDGLCTLLSNNGVGGTINILNNPSPCSNSSEVSNSCLVSIDDLIDSETIRISPNPVIDRFTLTGKKEVSQLIIYNGIGQLMMTANEVKKEINVSHLPKGVYLLKLEVGGQWLFKKMVIE